MEEMKQVAEFKSDFIVSKGNPLVNARFTLSKIEQKFILAVLSLVEPENDDLTIFSVDIDAFYSLLELNTTNKYRDMKNMTKRLMTRVIEIKEANGDLLQAHWVSSIKYKKGEARVEVEISKQLRPYLLLLKEDFTSYYLKYILKMDKKHSVRLYEIFRSKLHKSKKTYAYEQDLEYLQKILETEYTPYDFKKRVLTPSLKEINELTDIDVYVKDIKNGKKTVGFQVSIYDKCQREVELHAEEEKFSF